jgi:outer membrane usher protein
VRRTLFALLLVAAPGFAQVPDDVEPAFLLASVNGQATTLTATFWQRDGKWQADAEQWLKLGIVLTDAERKVAVLDADALGVALTINQDAASVDLLVPIARLPRQTLGQGPTMPELSDPAPGVLINYNLAGQFTQGTQAVSVGHEARTAGRFGMLTTSGQVNWRNGAGADYVRGDSRWQFDDYGRQLLYQAGDVRSAGATSTALGGVRIAKDPTLDPYTPTYPVPLIGGVALDASTVEILANQARVAQHDVSEGTFTVERFPLRPGRNAMDVVVRDALGREQIVSSQQLYFSPQMLRQGLTTWSVAAGAVRQGTTNDYGKTGVSVEAARGLSDTWTVSGSAQTDGEHHNAIIGARTVLGAAGVLDVQAGQSSGQGGSGSFARVQYHYAGPRVGLAMSHERSDGFWQLSANDSLGLQARQRTQAAITWNSEDHKWRARASAVDLATAVHGHDQHIRYAEVGMGWQSGKQSLTASGLFDMERHATTLALGYRYQFNRGSMTATARQAPDLSRVALTGNVRTEVAGKPVSVRGELAQVNGQQQARVSADARLDHGWARVEASQQDGETRVNGEFSGAVHIGRGGATWLPHVAGGYAVVEVAGVPGVPVRANGRTVGKTNSAGRVVIPDLRALVATPIRIDDRALPPGVQLATSELTVAPRRLSGARASFTVLAHDARAFTVHRAAPIEPGTVAQSAAGDTMIGFDGALFLEHPRASQRLTITDKAGSCSITLPAPLPAWDEQPTLECQ